MTTWSVVCVQVYSFNLLSAAPNPTMFDLTNAVSSIIFSALTVRVVSSTNMMTTLLVGGVNTNGNPQYPGVVIYISVAVGSSSYTKYGSVVLPSTGAGVTALSQTSPLLPGSVLASTDEGVFKCAKALLLTSH